MLDQLERALCWKCKRVLLRNETDRAAPLALGLSGVSLYSHVDIVIVKRDLSRFLLPDCICLTTDMPGSRGGPGYAKRKSDLCSVCLRGASSEDLDRISAIADETASGDFAYKCMLLSDERLPAWIRPTALRQLWRAASHNLRFSICGGTPLCSSPEALLLEWAAAGES